MQASAKPTKISNKYGALAEEDNGDDEDDMVKALQQISPHVHVGPKLSQRQKKSQPSTTKLTQHKIAAIARQVNSGEMLLPSLDLDNNDDYNCVWALMDSGAGRPCANKKKHFPEVTTPSAPSKVKLSTATSEEVLSRGVFKVQFVTAEGNVIEQEFEDTDVDMPILSVTSLSDNGSEGSQVNFRNDGGEVVDLSNNRSSNVVKRRGVYFIKLFMKKVKSGQCSFRPKDLGFTRPGSA